MTNKIEQKIVALNPIMIHQEQVNFTNEAEHVGIIRSTSGNWPNLMNRIACCKKATNATLAFGLAKGHRSNPAACLHVLQLYGTPVLMSGLASLVLNPSEVTLVHQFHKHSVQSLQKLHHGTPQAVIFFLAGCLPATATLHMRQFTNFGMVCRMQDDPLHKHALHVLTTAQQNCSSWFTQLRNLCLQYDLPHPLTFLTAPLSKMKFKNVVKTKIREYWEEKLRAEAAPLSSLEYFKPEFMSLTRTHPLWSSAGSNPYEVAKAVIQARMLSGRYRTRLLSSNWSERADTSCISSSCVEDESLEHILLQCPAYATCRANVVKKWRSAGNPVVAKLAQDALDISPSAYLVQFILDPSVLPQVRLAVQVSGVDILNGTFSLARTWCYAMHRERLKLLGVWKFN